MGAFAILLLIFLMAFGVPVAWSFAVVLAYLVFVFDVSTTTLLLQGFRSLDHLLLLALPLFVLAGYLMRSGGIARHLIDFIESMVKGQRGGLGASMVFTSGVFGAISGTASGAVASIGTIMITPLAQRGYPRGYTSALLGMSSLLGILIPPSITMILFGVVTRQSITALFAASIGPGLLLLVGLVLYNRFMAGRMFQEEYLSDNLGVERTRWSTFKKAIPALILPVIILGSIYGGIATPTEAASIAVICAILIGIFVYREMSLKHLKDSIIAAGETTGTIMLILLFSFMIGKILTAERVPQELTEAITGMVQNPIMILLLVNGFLIAAGMIMDDLSVTVVIAPLLLPLMTSVGVDPVHYGTIVACSVVIAANSPPVAPILYMACRIGQVSIHRALVPAILQIIFVGIPVLAITTFVPFVSLAIPRLLGVY